MEPTMNQSFPQQTKTYLYWVGIGWFVWGALGLLSFFLPQYHLVGKGLNGLDLIQAVVKDLSKFAEFIGEFTTFMMYLSLLLLVVSSSLAMYNGLQAIRGTKVNWQPLMVVGIGCVVSHLLTHFFLNDSSGSGFAAILSKLRPEPSMTFWAMNLLLFFACCATVILGVSGMLTASQQLEKETNPQSIEP